MFLVECNGCRSKAFTADGNRLDASLACECCPEDHDHGENANATGEPCRPVTIYALPGSVQLRTALGGN